MVVLVMAGLLSQEFNEGLFVLNDMELRPIEFKKFIRLILFRLLV